MKILWRTERLVLQPTTFCNINCRYCYLAERQRARRMNVEVVERIADWIINQDGAREFIWHGGEPLSTGIQHFRSLVEALEPARRRGLVDHVVQTNGTLISPEWCDLFSEYEFSVGVSIDGPQPANQHRVDWKGRETFLLVKQGIRHLRESGIPFFALCVVTNESLHYPEELYDFFSELGCTKVGFNIEERLGPNADSASDERELVVRFWKRLFHAWNSGRKLAVREFIGLFSWLSRNESERIPSHAYDLFPTIGWDGQVAVLAPELLGVDSERYGSFSIGNVLDEPLSEILRRAPSSHYVRDYEAGVAECLDSCDYFELCKGGVASNKYFELGTTGGTETVYCRNREQRLADGVLDAL